MILTVPIIKVFFCYPAIRRVRNVAHTEVEQQIATRFTWPCQAMRSVFTDPVHIEVDFAEIYFRIYERQQASHLCVQGVIYIPAIPEVSELIIFLLQWM